ncbi:MAG: hypothetical protein EPO39_19895 [Candidatus Manganitrophaceae bacterium]|nr:MAG: hypothetical protein EPO39_19895 [Candidatus Manganitrophaceae bacterium]
MPRKNRSPRPKRPTGSPKRGWPEGGRVSLPADPQPLWKSIAAALLSLLFAGLGHLILEQYVRAGILIAAGLVVYSLTTYWPPLTALNIVLFVFAAFDAFSIGRRGFGIV